MNKTIKKLNWKSFKDDSLSIKDEVGNQHPSLARNGKKGSETRESKLSCTGQGDLVSKEIKKQLKAGIKNLIKYNKFEEHKEVASKIVKSVSTKFYTLQKLLCLFLMPKSPRVPTSGTLRMKI